MYFTTTEVCPTPTCSKPLDVFFEHPDVPDPDTTFGFSCPICGNRILLRSGVARAIDSIPNDAIMARRTALITVLIIDDDPDVRDSLSMLLSQDGFYVRTCPSRDNAIELLEKETPDAIIVDWNMPGMILETFVDTIRQRHPTLPLILHSAAPKASEIADLLAIPFLPKPMDPDQLTSAIRTIVTRT